MDAVAAHEEELSLLKNTDLGSYFAGHDDTCEVITTARKCINDCNVQSNPFELQVMVAHCNNETKEKIQEIEPCFTENGSKIYDTCVSKCGDYRKKNDFVHELTKSTGPNITPEVAQEIFQKSNEACGIFKCMTRCSVEETKNVCGEEKSNILQNLIQDIINAQRADIERLNIVETMAKSNPPQCNYMYSPEAMFKKDNAGIEFVGDLPETLFKKDPSAPVQNEDKQVFILNTQMKVLAKQLQVLEKQEQILDKENHKLNLELVLLQQKEYQNERVIY